MKAATTFLLLPALGTLFLLSACGRSAPTTAPQAPGPKPPRLELAEPISFEFRDFMQAVGYLSHDPGVTFGHPDLPQPILFISQPDRVGPVDPFTIRLKRDQILCNGEAVDDMSSLEAQITEYAKRCRLVGEKPKGNLRAYKGVTFAQGLEVLRLLSVAGVLELEGEVQIDYPSVPHPQRPVEKPVPPWIKK